MAFSYTNTGNGKEVFDVAAPNIDIRTTAGAVKALVVDGVLQGGTTGKTQIVALTNITTAAPTDLPTVIADIAAIKAKINEIIAALKA
ncbi:head fiber protein [Pseudomonas phage tf]|jgi:hypothetical protein|uniref:Head fiber protein n=1 Tax=Pseudomonas phage tf TaxID=1114179 RepID=I2FLR9_9CAUD|nr:head fiber protein [Pseudomonas phage tf]CCE60803.1 hypothetical protein tf_50 [Pseudomonas phage tf]